MIIALAGRRIDAPDAATPRFPLANVASVAQRVRELLEAERVTALVSSAACGADLVAQSAAGKLGLRRRVILPFARERFLTSSVTDRPGDWGGLYNELLDAVAAAGDLVVLSGAADESAAYAAVNRGILDDAEALARASALPLTAVLVWDGSSRGAGDLTEAFGAEARRRGVRVLEVRTV
jgi:hypothetical protein